MDLTRCFLGLTYMVVRFNFGVNRTISSYGSLDNIFTGTIGGGSWEDFSGLIYLFDGASDALYNYGTFVTYGRYGTFYIFFGGRFTRITITRACFSLIYG